MVKPVKKAVKKQDENFEQGDDALTINMDEVHAQSFELIPKGTYDVVIEKLEYSLSKSSGAPMWSVQLTITDGDFANRKLFTHLSFSEGALPGTKAAIQKIAPDLLSSAFNPKKIAEEGSLVGIQARVKTGIETYQGEDRSKVKTWLAAAGADFQDND